jgi:hypothetical protein
MSSISSKTEKTDGGVVRVYLSGSIDESADLDGALASAGRGAIINLEGIERINSMGIHRWIPVVAKLAEEHGIIFEHLSYPVALQANVVANLFGGAKVLSCIAPYFCNTCQDDRTVVVTSEEVQASAGTAPAKRCETCDDPMEFDELDTYFLFLR